MAQPCAAPRWARPDPPGRPPRAACRPPRERCRGQRALLWGPASLQGPGQAAGIWPGCRDLGRLRCPVPQADEFEVQAEPSARTRAVNPAAGPDRLADGERVPGTHRCRGYATFPRCSPAWARPHFARLRSKPMTTPLNSRADGDFPKSNRLLFIRVDNGCPVGLGSPHLTPGGARSNGQLRLPQGH